MNDNQLNCFVWPPGDCPMPEHGSFASEDDVPTVDLAEMLAADAIGRACSRSGFFQVINHGVDHKLIDQVHEVAHRFFDSPEAIKSQAARAVGDSFGFAGKSTGRFGSKCPWKETFSLQYAPNSNIKEYLFKVYREEYEQHCTLYETYCQAMEKLGRRLMELIAQSLNLEPDAFLSYFSSGFSIFRLNFYPPSEHFSRLLGTGPHTDPCALTILHQDQVGGLQVCRDQTWVTVRPRSDAFVISIGDTFQALCNHRYKSAKHRAVIHATKARQSLVYFLNPGLGAVIKPVPELIDGEHPQRHAEFNWGQLLEFTQKHYRTDVNTLDAFEEFMKKQKKSKIIAAA